MNIDVLGANFDYSGFSLINVKGQYYLVDPTINVSIDLASRLVSIKEISHKSKRDWVEKAAAAVIGEVVFGHIAALIGGIAFGNEKVIVCELKLDNNDTLKVEVDGEMYDMLNRYYQKRCFGERQGNYAFES